MKSYEIWPAGMAGSRVGGGCGGGRKPKPYEIMPAAGTAAQGLGGKRDGCGCGGKCGGGTGHEMPPPGMKKAGGCGGRCGGLGGEIFRSPSKGTILTAPLMPSEGLPGANSISRIFSWSIGGIVDLSAGLDAASAAANLWTLSCAELQKIIDDLVARIRFLETAPNLPPGACGDCPPDVDCNYPCNGLSEPELTQCVCTRLSRGLSPGVSMGSYSCQGITPERQRDYNDLCDRGPTVSRLLDQLRRLLAEMERRQCGRDPNPPPRPLRPPPWEFCHRHPELCDRLFYCQRHPLAPECRSHLDFGIPPWADPLSPPPPVTDPGVQACNDILAGFRAREGPYNDALTLYNLLNGVMTSLRASAPRASPTCASSPACDAIRGFRTTLQNGLASFRPTPGGADARSSVRRAVNAVGIAIDDLGDLIRGCDEVDRRPFPEFFLRCAPLAIDINWSSARLWVWRQTSAAYQAVIDAADAADAELDDEMLGRALRGLGCRVPSAVPRPPEPRLPW